jgi:hypothetical protein
VNERERQLELCREYALREGLAVHWSRGLEGEDAAAPKGEWGKAEPAPEHEGARGAWRGEFDTYARKRNPIAGSAPSEKVFVETDGTAALEVVRSLELPGSVEIESGGGPDNRHLHFDPPEGWSGPTAFLFEVDEATGELNVTAKGGNGQYLRLPGATHRRKTGEVARFVLDENGEVPPVARLSPEAMERLLAAAGHDGTSSSTAEPVALGAKLQDGRKRHSARLAMALAGSWCSDPAGVALAVEAMAPFIYAPKDGEPPVSKNKDLLKEIRRAARTAARKGDARLTREAVAKQDAADELGRALDDAAPDVPDPDVVVNEAWAAWDLATGDPIKCVLEGIPPLVFLPGLEGVVVKGSDIVISAEYKAGKTFLLVAWVMMLALEGYRVLVVDFENGENQYARRVDEVSRAWKLSRDDLLKIRANLTYKQFPELTRDDAKRFAVQAVKSDMVVFDAIAGLMERFGIEENDNDGAKELHRKIMEPLKRAGATCVTLANSGHGNVDRMRGASGWLGAFEGVYSLKGEAFSTDKSSDVTLSCRRSRYGVVGEWVWRMGGGTYTGPVTAEDASEPVEETFQRQAERILRRSDRMSATKLLGEISDVGAGVRKEKGLRWLDLLSDDAESCVMRDEDGLYFAFAPTS